MSLFVEDRDPARAPMPLSEPPAAARFLPSPSSPIVRPTSDRAPLVDPFGRTIRYLRVSVTDRCDFRCRYCMSEDTVFLPRRDVLSLEELDRLCSIFVGLGTRKIRLTGGEPLVRKGVVTFVEALARHLATGDLEELTLTTNGSRLAAVAGDLAAAGIRRVNVSLDTLDAEKFHAVTRNGDLARVRAGIDAALAAGLSVKLNTVVLEGFNEDEFDRLLAFAHGRGMEMTLIEVMPLGGDRSGRFLPLSVVRADLARRWRLEDVPRSTGGPARWVRVAETGGLLGFITPMSHTFCERCNRVRLTCTGTLHLCLGQNAGVDLRDVLRASPDDDAPVLAAVRAAVARKPEGHGFAARAVPVDACRHMNTTGG